MSATDESVTPEPDQAQEEAEPEVSVQDLLKQLLAEQQAHRAEVAKLREEVNAQKKPAPAPQQQLSEEDLLAQRMEEVGQHDFYCPGCGGLFDYQQKCTGGVVTNYGHQPIEVKSTDELKEGDPAKHTASPVLVP